MEKQDYLDRLHHEILDIMDEIHRICTTNNLTYYLAEGSLLGAIRHQGFIPWDDDLDIAMPRRDLERFIEIAPRCLNDNYCLECVNTNDSYTYFFPKIWKKNTLFVESGVKNGKNTGIFVDIFPLDESPNFSKILEFHKKAINQLHLIGWCKKNPNWTVFGFFYSLIAQLFSYVTLNCMMTTIAKHASKYGSSHYANFGSLYQLAKETMPKAWYGDGVKIPFEGRLYMVPSEYKKVASNIYGKSYMQLPPIEKRRCHYPSKVVFSDGVVMEFDHPQHIVTIKEQES